MWCLAGLSTTTTPELATLALLRARACELVGESLRSVESAELFLVGLFSLLDVMLSTPMPVAIEGLASRAGIDAPALIDAYTKALQWVQDVTRG